MENGHIKVVGVGGGAINAINHMCRLGVDDVSFIVTDTDRQSLDSSPVPTKVLLGPETCYLRNWISHRIAHDAAEESAAEIGALFDDDTKIVFVITCLSGGTGTGASPVIARLAKEHGILTVGIVTIPFLFEGQERIIKAIDGAAEMGKYVDALLVINNERLSEIYKDLDLFNTFDKADDILTTTVTNISKFVTCDGHIPQTVPPTPTTNII